MDSGIGCALAPVVSPSKRGGPRVESVSLPDYESLRSPRDFRRVLGRGIRRRHGGIVLVRTPGGEGPPRVGLVVTRSSGGAVTRNRVKRRLRHAIAGLTLQPGTDYVIIANREVSEVPFTQLEAWLGAALDEAAR
jgi:ribonuclease P protein component